VSNWQSVNASNFLPPEIPQALTTITSLVDQFLDLYKQALTAAKIYQKVLGGGGPDIIGTLVNAVVDIVEGFLQAGKIHILFTPIPKTIPATGFPLPATLDDYVLSLGFDSSEITSLTDDAKRAFSQLLEGESSLGNNGFFRTFAQSLSDVRDPNRPQYTSPNDYVAMTVLMFGAPTFAEAINVAGALNRIFQPTSNDLTARTIPVPQNVRIKTIAAENSSTVGVRLDWDPPPPAAAPLFFPTVSLAVKEYAIIRCTSAKLAQAARTVLDFFSTTDLKAGLTSDDEAKSAVVVATGKGSSYAYIDDSELSSAVQYYYCVAWKVDSTEAGKTTTLPYDRVSNVVSARPRAIMPPFTGEPPNWDARGSVLSVMPDLAAQVRVLLERIRVLADRKTGGPAEALTNTITLLEKNLERFALQLDQLNAQAKRLNAMFNVPLPSLYSTSFSGVGGNSYLLGELARRLNDTSDENRPPYDGNEYVMGVCIVAGGPRQADIQPIIDFLASLFGSEEEANPLFDVLTSLDAVVDAQETFVFGPDLSRYTVASDGTVTTPDGETVPATDIDPTTGLPTVTPKPVIADSGTPVDTLDPLNPDAGQTNVKTSEDLC